MDASDVLIEVLDARDPMGCRCSEVCFLLCSHRNSKSLFDGKVTLREELSLDCYTILLSISQRPK